MSKSNLDDSQADVLAAVALVSVVLAWVFFWLNGLPA
ncbi:MAG: hypothetical protein RLZZ602_2066 [Pseudomonadota bacterium]|jgi:hypothetical protein